MDDIIAYLWRRRLWFGVLPVVLAILGFTSALLTGVPYRASSSFYPNASSGGMGRFAGLAGQFGISVPQLDAPPLEFYGKLLESRELLEATAAQEFTVRTDDGNRSGDLATVLQIEEPDSAKRLRKAVGYLDASMSISLDGRAEIVSLQVESEYAELAEQLNATMLSLLNTFNLSNLQAQAAAEREFIQQRVATARAELDAAESALEQFLERNRTYQSSPQLAFEAARLERRVDLHQQVYTSLAENFEQARIDEVRNTPVITILDAPEGSARPTNAALARALLGIVLGLMIAVGLALLKDFTPVRDMLRSAFRRSANGEVV